MNKELTQKLEKLWLDFNAAGIVNPLTVIEQITYLIFLKLLDERESRNEQMKKKGLKAQFIFNGKNQHLRWSEFRHKKGDEMLKVIRDDVFPHMREFTAKDENFGQFFKDAILMIPTGRLMQSAVDQVDGLPLSKGDDKGDLYEWMLNRITQSGLNGQFRTPRHIIQLMVEMLDPQPTDFIADPAAGTSGFLINTYLHILKNHSSEDGQIKHDDGHIQYLGDKLTEYQEHIQNGMLTGFEMDATMLRIGSMNLLLHGIDSPHIFYQDSLGKSFKDSPKYGKYAENYFDVVLANPPFKGTVDEEHLDTKLTGDVNTKKTELLFLVRMLKMLKPGGRCAVIVPDGVLFGSSKAHRNLRKILIEDNQLEGIVSLPSGVFKPYAGVSTAIVIFTKSGRTKDVWFYDLTDDGFSLDDKRIPLYDDSFAGDLPDCLKRWQKKDLAKESDRKEKAFFVPKEKIVENNYDLSVNRYKEIAYVEEEYDTPKKILQQLKSSELSISNDLNELSRYVDDKDYKGFDPNTAKRRIKLD